MKKFSATGMFRFYSIEKFFGRAKFDLAMFSTIQTPLFKQLDFLERFERTFAMYLVLVMIT